VLLNSITDFRKELDNNNKLSKLGLVPTMGALHHGHLSLIEKAKEVCDVVAVSVFVNPTQFTNPNDLSKYPRTLDKDLEIIHKLGEGILVYVPSVEEIYPHETHAEHFDFGTLSKFMEGEYRHGHFDGVGTVLKRLFNLINPDYAYFGEKDYQQLAVVKKLVEITGQNVKIIGCETYREPNGLAKSSRNKLLTEEEKKHAGIIFECLNLVKHQIKTKSILEIKKLVKDTFKTYKNFKLEYCEVASEKDLKPTQHIKPNQTYRAFIAAYCNEVRLIDNMSLN
jgi:pantoate--beta-alanine ligase